MNVEKTRTPTYNDIRYKCAFADIKTDRYTLVTYECGTIEKLVNVLKNYKITEDKLTGAFIETFDNKVITVTDYVLRKMGF